MPSKPGFNIFGRPKMVAPIVQSDVQIADDDDDEDEDEEEDSNDADEVERGKGLVGGADQKFPWMDKSSGEEGKYDDADEDTTDDELSEIPGKGSALDRLKLERAKRKRQKDSNGDRCNKRRRQDYADAIRKNQELEKQQQQQQQKKEAEKEKKKQEETNWLKAPLRHPNIPEKGWHGVEVLGKGGQGRTGLWVHVDDQMKIDDRMAVKDVSHAPGLFDDDEKDNQEDDYWAGSTPREAHIGMLLAGSPGIVKTRNFSGSKVEQKYRLYMDFVGYESLESIISLQVQEVRFTENNVEKVTKIPAPYPEPFIWFVMSRLAKAAEQLAEPTKIREKYTDWKDVEVVHHDIKKDNIFLAAPDAVSFPFYPSPLLGDFGSARITHKKDDSNPFRWQTWITEGYIPPDLDPKLRKKNFEEIKHARAKKKKAPPRRRHTQAINIWQIGQVCRLMMCLGDGTLAGAEQIQYLTKPEDHWMLPMTGVALVYSAALVDLVASCLDPEPGLRPKPYEIVATCVRNDARLDGMATRATGATKIHNMLRYEKRRDNYKNGMMLTPRPAARAGVEKGAVPK